MNETRRRLDPRALLGAVAVVLVAAAFWAASAFAAGGSSSAAQSESDGSAAAYVQSQGETPDRDDCPERDGDSDGESTQSSNV
jgi:nitrous oxide reductase